MGYTLYLSIQPVGIKLLLKMVVIVRDSKSASIVCNIDSDSKPGVASWALLQFGKGDLFFSSRGG